MNCLKKLKAGILVSLVVFPLLAGETDPIFPVVSASLVQGRPSAGNPVELKVGTPIERKLSGGEAHSYLYPLKSNEFIDILVEQKGIDVVVRLFDSAGKVLTEMDSPNGARGPERLVFVTQTSETCRIEVSSLTKTDPPGDYILTLKAHRSATEKDIAEAEAVSLVSQIEKLRAAGKFDQAFPLAVKSLELTEKIFGHDDMALTGPLNQLASLHQLKGRYSEAELLFLRALAIKEKLLPPDSLEIALSLNNLALNYRDQAQFAKAEPLFLRTVAILEKHYGPEHINIAATLNNLGLVYQDQSDFGRAESAYQRALAIREKLLGPNHRAVAQSLTNLGTLYQSKGDYARANECYYRALDIREKVLGPNHPEVGTTLQNLALVFTEKGDYAQAVSIYTRALAIQEKALGQSHPASILILNNLALVYRMQGEFSKAEPLYQRALAAQEKALGPVHPLVALSLHNLGGLYYEKGDYVKAEPLLERARMIREKISTGETPELATTLNALATIARDQGDYAKAEALAHRGLALYEKAFGHEHMQVGFSLNFLALINASKGDLVQAEQFYNQALTMWEKLFGPEHPQVALSLFGLARIYQMQGNSQKAEPLLKRSLAIREKALGGKHPDVARTLNELATLYQTMGNYPEALRFQVKANEASERDLTENLILGSERQKILYLNQTGAYTDQTISLHTQFLPADIEALKAAVTVILRRKGRVLDATSQNIEQLRSRTTPEDQLLLDELTKIRQIQSALTLKGPGTRNREDHLGELVQLEKQAEDLEAKVSARSLEFQARRQPITLDQVQKAIPEDAVLIEFAGYTPFDAKLRTFGPRRYVAYVVKGPKSRGTKTEPLESGSLLWADLGPADVIDQLATEFRKAIRTQLPMTSESQNSVGGPKLSIQLLGRELDKRLMQPVRKLLGNRKHLLLATDGELNLIPFSALIDEHQKFLIERYTVTNLTSGRDLLRLQVKVDAHSPPMILADPDYATGNGPTLFDKQLKPLSRLIGTKQEARIIQTELPEFVVKLGAEATKSVLESVDQPKLLHIATHGYFLENAGPSFVGTTDQRSLAALTDTPVDFDQLKQNTPLLRSFLFLAEANKSEIGIMTAAETAQLNLWGTKLVVLSACETGLGDVKNGEGVYGLRRALVLAGSEAQMISLWAISDRGTQELMAEYYHRLKAGEGRSQALRNTQLKLLKDPKRQHPFYWASFIQSGEWRPL